MRHKFGTRILLLFSLLSLIIPNVGCTKEKAEAIKSSAEQFRVEAKSAIELVRNLARQDVAMPTLTDEEEAKDIVDKFKGVKPEKVDEFVASRIGRDLRFSTPLKPLEEDFKDMEESYELFASMYRSLPRGNFLAKDAVQKSKTYAIKVTAQMVILAKAIEKNPLQLHARRLLLVERLKNAQKITDATAFNQAVMLGAQELLRIKDEESKSNEAAILQCLKAAETGKLVVELVEGYKKLSVNDMLNLTKNSLSIISDVTGGNKDVKAAIVRYDSFVKNKINTDPLWKDVLGNIINRQTVLNSQSNP